MVLLLLYHDIFDSCRAGNVTLLLAPSPAHRQVYTEKLLSVASPAPRYRGMMHGVIWCSAVSYYTLLYPVPVIPPSPSPPCPTAVCDSQRQSGR